MIIRINHPNHSFSLFCLSEIWQFRFSWKAQSCRVDILSIWLIKLSYCVTCRKYLEQNHLNQNTTIFLYQAWKKINNGWLELIMSTNFMSWSLDPWILEEKKDYCIFIADSENKIHPGRHTSEPHRVVILWCCQCIIKRFILYSFKPDASWWWIKW